MPNENNIKNLSSDTKQRNEIKQNEMNGFWSLRRREIKNEGLIAFFRHQTLKNKRRVEKEKLIS